MHRVCCMLENRDEVEQQGVGGGEEDAQTVGESTGKITLLTLF